VKFENRRKCYLGKHIQQLNNPEITTVYPVFVRCHCSIRFPFSLFFDLRSFLIDGWHKNTGQIQYENRFIS